MILAPAELALLGLVVSVVVYCCSLDRYDLLGSFMPVVMFLSAGCLALLLI